MCACTVGHDLDGGLASLSSIAWEAMMVNSYYGIYQDERGKTAVGIRVADAQVGGLAAGLGQLGWALASPVRAVRRSLRRQRPAACRAAPDAG